MEKRSKLSTEEEKVADGAESSSGFEKTLRMIDQHISTVVSNDPK